MDTWGALLIAVVTAIATVGLTEVAHYFRQRLAARNRIADWDVSFLPMQSGIRGRIALIENTGEAAAFDVEISMTGDAEFELNPDSRFSQCNPREKLMMMVTRAGTGLVRIEWKDSRGRRRGPVDRFPNG